MNHDPSAADRERVGLSPPTRLERVPQELRIDFAGRTVASTRDGWRVLETSHPPVYYLPRNAFTCTLLPSARRRSLCEWKGSAAYWSLEAEGRTAVDCAWSYPDPVPAFAAIRNHLAVYPARWTLAGSTGNGAAAAGRFLRRLITENLRGPFKGTPGTMHW